MIFWSHKLLNECIIDTENGYKIKECVQISEFEPIIITNTKLILVSLIRSLFEQSPAPFLCEMKSQLLKFYTNL